MTRRSRWRIFRRMSDRWAFYRGGVHEALIETLHIASLGTIAIVRRSLRHPRRAQHRFERARQLRGKINVSRRDR